MICEMREYKIIDDSGVDYQFLGDSRSWSGALVIGTDNEDQYGNITVRKPFNLTGYYTAHNTNFERTGENHE